MSTRTRDVRSYVVSAPTGLSARGAQKIALFNPDGTPYSPGGAGGSSFAHLSENEEQETIFTDYYVASVPDPSAPDPWATTSTSLNQDGHFNSTIADVFQTSFDMSVVGDLEARVALKGDGFHFGDGVSPADAKFGRVNVAGDTYLRLGGDSNSALLINPDGRAYVWDVVGGDYIEMGAGQPGDPLVPTYIKVSNSEETQQTELSPIGLMMKSPDGTAYNITVANGGTLAVAAA